MSLNKNKRIYLDYMASCPVDKRILDAMGPYWRERYAHPWSIHRDGVKANKDINEALDSVAENLGAKPSEIIFTSGGTESTTQATKGLLDFIEENNGALEGLHIILSEIEHPSVGGVIEYAKYKGMDVSVISVEENGVINPKKIKEALKPETVLISIMYVNSEIGTIQPIKEISKIIKDHRKSIDNAFFLPNLDFKFPAFHTDASQASLYLDCNVDKLGVDLMTLDAHKMYGPKGVGVLYIRKGLLLKPLLFGQNNKSHIRHGTPPVPLIIGFAKTYEIAVKERDDKARLVKEIRDYLIDKVLTEIPIARLNGDREMRSPHNASFSFKHMNHEFLAVQLDEKSISVATRSACSSGGGSNSHVIKALFDHRQSSAIRFSIGKETTKNDIDYVVRSLKESISINT